MQLSCPLPRQRNVQCSPPSFEIAHCCFITTLATQVRNATTGEAIEPFTAANCVAMTTDSTRVRVQWRGDSPDGGLDQLAGQPVQLHFSFSSGSLYSFWVAESSCGASGGYVAGGGPGIGGDRDTHGSCTR
jgi:hypothetical protein